MKDQFANKDGKIVVENLIRTIQENKEYLSRVDGLIGDGDHGINMNKGFTITEEQIASCPMSMSEALKVLSTVLVEDIGGSMGPLYGMLFSKMARASKKEEFITKEVFAEMLSTATCGIMDLGGAKVGDKSLVDVLYPANQAYRNSMQEGFSPALVAMKEAAKAGWQSTENMVSKIGRSSRLGERSRGVLDAGATSCYLILVSMADTIQGLIDSV